jgi:hypothetical protein
VRRLAKLTSLAVVGLVLVAAPASAQTLVFDPNGTSEGTRLEFDVDPRSGGEAPQSLSLMLVRGLRVDPRAVPERCLPAQAEAASCPAGSSIGRGHTEVTVTGYLEPDDSTDVISRIDAYLAPAAQPGDIAGIVFQLTELISKQRTFFSGRIVPIASGTFGYELRVDALPSGQPPPPFTASFKRLRLFLQARRKVVQTRRVRGKRVKRRVRRHLFRTPRTCPGSWPFEVRIRLPSGEERRPGAAECSGG